MKPIGYVNSCYRDKFGTPRQPGLVPSSWARIQISKEWQPEDALEGLDGFSHLWVLFEFHQNTNKNYHAKVHPPRMGGKTMGVFATRSPHRPNSIGLSLVKIEKIEKDSVVISGVDLVDGTPVFDIKPYLPEIEAIPAAQNGWTAKVEPKEIEVLWNSAQLEILDQWQKKLGNNRLKDLIEETLKLDPRPVVYRGYEGQESPYRQSHAVRLFDGDIHFSFKDARTIEIQKVLTGLS